MQPRNQSKNATLIVGVALLVANTVTLPAQAELPVAGVLRLDGATIVDTANGSLTPGMSILMERGQIVRITPTSATPPISSRSGLSVRRSSS